MHMLIMYNLLLKQRTTTISKQPRGRVSGFLSMIGVDAIISNPRDHLEVQATEVKCADPEDTFNISLTGTTNKWTL